MIEKRQFTIFSSHLDLAHSYWEKILEKGGWAIDATCGNGRDTLVLAQKSHPEAGVIGLDTQPQALQNTQNLLQKHLPSLDRIHLFLQDHREFPPLALQKPIRLIVYNLGYLPGGNKKITTQVDSTLQSLSRALELVLPGGAVSLTSYPGHPEGLEEHKALLDFTKNLDPKKWSVCFHLWHNRSHSPSLFFIQKNSF